MCTTMDLSPDKNHVILGGKDHSMCQTMISVLKITQDDHKQVISKNISKLCLEDKSGIFSIKFIDDDKRFLAGLNSKILIMQVSGNYK